MLNIWKTCDVYFWIPEPIRNGNKKFNKNVATSLRVFNFRKEN